MLKIIHTADIHIGKDLHGQSLEENHLAFFNQLKEIIRKEQPDALLVAGDTFQSLNPTIEAQRFFTEQFLAVHKAKEDMQIIITRGNHDSVARLDVTSPLWGYQNVNIFADVDRGSESQQPNLDANIVEIKKNGSTAAFVGAVPFLEDGYYPSFGKDGNRMANYYNKVIERIAELNTSHVPVILMGHMTVAGNIDITGHNFTVCGTIETMNVNDIGSGYDYFALGHIHRNQPIADTDEKAWYSGSPVAVSFDERPEHYINMVTFGNDNTAMVNAIRIDVPHQLVKIPRQTGDWSVAMEELKKYPKDKEDYILLNVWENTVPRLGLYEAQKVAEECHLKSTVLDLDPKDAETTTSTTELQQMDMNEFENFTPKIIGEKYISDHAGEDNKQELLDAFNDVLNNLNLED